MARDVNQSYNTFWKDLVETNGQLDIEKVKKELCDYEFLLDNVPIVYEEICGLSYPNYPASTILSEFRERHYDKGITQDDIKDMIENCSDKEELIQELKDYFDIE